MPEVGTIQLRNRVMVVAFIAGLLSWLVDAVVDTFYFYEGPFLDLLILDVPPREIYVRVVMLSLFFVFGLIITRLVESRGRYVQRIEHLNSVLRAIRDVNQLIVVERDPPRLLSQVCETLIEARAYNLAWLALTDDEGNITDLYSGGLDDLRDDFETRLREGGSHCMSRVREVGGSVAIARVDESCPDCPIVSVYGHNAAIVAPLHHQSERFGYLGVSVPRRALGDDEEQALIAEVAYDIAFALHGIRTERAARESEERFHRAISQAPFPIMLHAEDGEVLVINEVWTEITGYSHDDIPTIADWTERAYGERMDLVRERIERLHELDGRVDEGEYEVTTADGGTRVWHFHSAPLGELPDGRRLIHSAAMDVTERKRAEQAVERLTEELEERVRLRTAELEDANEELESFAYSVSHDLRAPLRAMDGFSEILLEDYADRLDEEARDHLQRISAAAQRMGKLIDDILQLARVSRAEMAAESVDLSAMAREIVDQLRQADPDRDVEISIQDGLTVEGDRPLLLQVLQNLLDNAWKFTGEEPIARIEFGATEQNGERVFHVRDNGVGFDMKYADRLFGTFQRLHGRDEFPGTGVGLATVRRIVHRHHGRVWADAEVDEGATFYFALQAQ